MNETDVGIEEADHRETPVLTRLPAETSAGGPSGGTGRSVSKRSSLEQDLDRVSLVQALNDTEAATARVIDITERLVDARQQITGLRGDLERMRIEYHQYRAEQETIKSSMAFRIASVIWNVRNALRL